MLGNRGDISPILWYLRGKVLALFIGLKRFPQGVIDVLTGVRRAILRNNALDIVGVECFANRRAFVWTCIHMPQFRCGNDLNIIPAKGVEYSTME